MMGHRTALKGGMEYDVLTRWRKVMNMNPGVAKLVKRKYNKRVRSNEKSSIRVQIHSP
jgi:hypothetical protein